MKPSACWGIDMTNRSHTPGPWFVWGGQIKPENGGWQQKRFIAEIPLHTSVEQSANARLIAAAPDLLEALETILICKTNDNGETPELSNYLAEQARAAIAKAKGEV